MYLDFFSRTDMTNTRLYLVLPSFLFTRETHATIFTITHKQATLPNIMKAKKKKVDTMAAEDFGLDLEPHNEVLDIFEPPPRKEGIIVDSVDALVDKLKNEAKVLK